MNNKNLIHLFLYITVKVIVRPEEYLIGFFKTIYILLTSLNVWY